MSLRYVVAITLGCTVGALVQARLAAPVEERPFVREQPTLGAVSAFATSRYDLRDESTISCENVTLTVTLGDVSAELELSRINEFEHVPRDRGPRRTYRWQELERRLRAHKASPFFADRTDLLVGARASDGAERAITHQDLVHVLAIAHRAGFTDAAIFDPAQRTRHREWRHAQAN